MDSKKLEAAIARYSKMSGRQVDIELRDAGIDPRPTIDAVMKLIHRAEATRRLHHPEKMIPRPVEGRMAGSKAARARFTSLVPPNFEEFRWPVNTIRPTSY